MTGIQVQPTEAQLHERVRQQQQVAAFGVRALATPQLAPLLDEAVELLAETLGAEYAKVLELQPGGRTLLLRAGVGWREGLVGRRTVPVGPETWAGFTLRSSGPVIVSDLQHETRFTAAPLLHEHGVVSGLSVVVPGLERPFGVIGVHSREHRRFTEDDVNFVQAIANVVGAAAERRAGELRLERYRLVVENTRDLVALLDERGRLVYASPSHEAVLGYAPAELVGQDAFELVHPEDRAAVDAAVSGGTQLAARLRHKSGGWVLLEGMVSAVRDPDGQTLLLTVARDMTQRWEAERALAESEARLRLVLRAGALGTFDWDLASGELVWSETTERLFGFEPGSFDRRYETFLERLHPDDRESVRAEVETALEVGQYEQEYRVVLPDGSVRWVYARGELLRDDKGQPMGLLGAATDISRRKRAEEERARLELELRQAHKMDAMGRVAGGVAHEFNNLLTVIAGFTELMLKGMTAEDPLRPHATQVAQASEQASALSRQLLAFSRRQVIETTTLDLNAFLAETDALLRRVLGDDVRLVTVLGAERGLVRANRSQLEQVIVNLAVNAREAMPGAAPSPSRRPSSSSTTSARASAA
jgi:PAS domain S-box-containing protein